MQVFHDKQKEALKLLHSPAKHIMLGGGRRSGKTYVALSDIAAACVQFAGLRALIARSHLSHVRDSIWNQTLPDVLKEYPQSIYKLNHGELRVKFWNGSTIDLAGFDDKERIEKHLGKEYAIIYNNECSTISYDAVLLAQSSLAQNIDGFNNKLYYDMNPPAPTHWTYKLFIEKVEPKTGEQLDDPENYQYLMMNPMDNPLLSEDYLKMLEALPERERRRYKYGEFVKIEGAIYHRFDLNKHSIQLEDLPQMEYFTVGIDNSRTYWTAILIGWSGGKVYLLDEYGAITPTAQEFNATIYHKWAQYNYVAYPDPSSNDVNRSIWNAQKTDNAVAPGINYINELIENERFYVLMKDNKCNVPNTISELESYRYDEKGRIVKENDHYMDGMRYGIWSHAKYGGSILIRRGA